MKILGIETSCDETAAAVVEDGCKLLSNVVASSVDLHVAYGGVVPEIAARSHLEVIPAVVRQAIADSGSSWDEIDAIAVTHGPGLGGSLLIGVMTARTLAITRKKPLLAVNHVLAHMYASFITSTELPEFKLSTTEPAFPLLCLTVSGGHSHLVLFHSHSKYEVLGRTNDDAVGEAFDKVAKLLGLPYPGGPSISAAAARGNPNAIDLPKAKLANQYDFSFSGLKTAVLRASQQLVGKDYAFPSSGLSKLLSEAQKADIAASFQRIAIETLVDKLVLAHEIFLPRSVVVAGGVAANTALRQEVNKRLSVDALFPDIKLCTDNAAMIAARAFYQYQSTHEQANPLALAAAPSLSI